MQFTCHLNDKLKKKYYFTSIDYLSTHIFKPKPCNFLYKQIISCIFHYMPVH